MMIENKLLKSENKLDMYLERNKFVATFCGPAERPKLTVVITSVSY
jgi:hypothetical protein